MKPILPSLKQKKRYMVFEIIANRKIRDFAAIADAIYSQSLRNLGEFEVAKAGIMVLGEKFNYQRQRCVVKVNNRYVDKVKAAMVMLTKISRQNVIMRCVGVSGILKKAEQKYLAM